MGSRSPQASLKAAEAVLRWSRFTWEISQKNGQDLFGRGKNFASSNPRLRQLLDYARLRCNYCWLMRQRRNSIEPKWKRSSTPRTITLPICVWMAPVKLCTLCAALLHCLLQVWPVAAVLVRPAAGYCAGPATEGRIRLSSCTDKRKPDAPYHRGRLFWAGAMG